MRLSYKISFRLTSICKDRVNFYITGILPGNNNADLISSLYYYELYL